MLIKSHSQYYFLYIAADYWPQWQLCAFSPFRWKYGFRISAPSIKRSWSMAADQRENISTAPAPSPPAPPGCPNFGRFPWRTKEPRCTQTITWTVLVTGIQTTTTLIRTRCPGLRWCELSGLCVFFSVPGARAWKKRTCRLHWTHWFPSRPPHTRTELCLNVWLIELVHIHCISCAFGIIISLQNPTRH